MEMAKEENEKEKEATGDEKEITWGYGVTWDPRGLQLWE